MSNYALTRQNSWPPTSKPLPPTPSERREILDSIDENPFSFFLTSPDEIDIDDYLSDDDLNAGIETPDSSHSPIREVSPSSLQRSPLPIPHPSFKEEFDDDIAIIDGDEEDEEFEYGFGMAIPLTLQEYTRNTTPSSGRKSRTGQYRENARQEEQTRGLGITLPDFSARGRARVRLVPARPGRGRMSRSLSARRPSSWRAPSPEIFSIREERESDEEDREKGGVGSGIGIGIRVENEVGEEIYSMSAPASSRIGPGGLASPGLGQKVKKRVHWAL